MQAGLILVPWLLMYLGTSKPIILYNYCNLRIMVDTYFIYIHQHQERFNNIKGYDLPRRCILLAVVDQRGAKMDGPLIYITINVWIKGAPTVVKA